MNFRYPIFLDLAGKKCLVVGEGYEVPGKVRALVDASALVTYIHPQADPKIEELATLSLIAWKQRDFLQEDLQDCFLVIADSPHNKEIFTLAEQQRILCNAVDDPENCRFSFGSVHRRGDLTIAISTNGWAPAVAVRLREKLERDIGPEYGLFLKILRDVRPTITSQIPDFAARRELWYRIVDSDVLELLRLGRDANAVESIQKMVDEATRAAQR